MDLTLKCPHCKYTQIYSYCKIIRHLFVLLSIMLTNRHAFGCLSLIVVARKLKAPRKSTGTGLGSNQTVNLILYVLAVDEIMKGECDNPTIDLLICKYKDGMTVEWSFRSMGGPLGVFEYENELQTNKRNAPISR